MVREIRSALMSVALIAFCAAASGCATPPPSSTATASPPTVTPTNTAEPTATDTKTPTVVPTATDLVDKLAGPKPKGQGVVLDSEKHRWKNAEGKFWSPEIDEWVNLRNANGAPIYLLGGPTNLYNVMSPTLPMYIYSGDGVLSDQGSFFHSPNYDTEFSQSFDFRANSVATQLAGDLTIFVNYPTPRSQVSINDVIKVLDRFNGPNPTFEFTMRIPSNVHDPKTEIQHTCDLGKGHDVVFTAWDKAADPSFHELGFRKLRWKFNCDSNSHRVTATAAFKDKSTDHNKRLAILGPLLTEIIDGPGGHEPEEQSDFSDYVLALANAGKDSTIGSALIQNNFIDSVGP